MASSTNVKAPILGKPRLEILSHSASLISFEVFLKKSNTCVVYLSTTLLFLLLLLLQCKDTSFILQVIFFSIISHVFMVIN